MYRQVYWYISNKFMKHHLLCYHENMIRINLLKDITIIDYTLVWFNFNLTGLSCQYIACKYLINISICSNYVQWRSFKFWNWTLFRITWSLIFGLWYLIHQTHYTAAIVCIVPLYCIRKELLKLNRIINIYII